MKYKISSWTISDIVHQMGNNFLSLSPSYQRNEVWAPADQRELISTVLKRWPMPNIFVLKNVDGTSEMVDGKQRILAIFNFLNDRFRNSDRRYFSELSEKEKDEFLSYAVPVVLITDLEESARIESFYALVNKSGLRLNRPEVTRAEFSETPFHHLVDRISEDPHLVALGIFTERNQIRLNDYELIAELLATIEFGIFDKKTKVDALYEISDSSLPIWQKLQDEFAKLTEILASLDQVFPLKITRFKKRADFLSLCYFFWSFKDHPIADLKLAHNAFSVLAPGIAPSNRRCKVLRAYAHNCVSQSHTKSAREARDMILKDLLVNLESEPSQSQKSVLEYFKLPADSGSLICAEIWHSLDPDLLERNRPTDHLFGEPESIEFPF